MEALAESLSKTSLPTIMVIAGVFFLFLSIGGQLGAQIATDSIQRKLSGILGIVLLVGGISFYFVGKSSHQKSVEPVSDEPATRKFYLLRPNSVKPGRTIEGSSEINIQDATLTIQSDGESVAGKISIEGGDLTRTEVISSLHGHTTALKKKILADSIETTIHIGKNTETEYKNGVLQGHTILIENQNGIWVKSLVGAKATKAQQMELQESYADEHEFYPATAIEVGSDWTLAGPQLAHVSGLGNLLSVSGSAHLVFERLVKCGDGDCALISVRRLEIKGEKLVNGEIMQLKLGGHGVIHRSLSEFIDTKFLFNGHMLLEGIRIGDDNGRVKVKVLGPCRLSGSERLISD
uniref:Uncharacterized protein n=1 Tax=Candidatus Kentrum sp. LFY TaxID=2126342 RepID=A0A450U830_9GAMM|nr:MAG: hypothetical protein BECKLFY1418A_GA0070994_100343 [Candidatus Kentron sp. LFY]